MSGELLVFLAFVCQGVVNWRVLTRLDRLERRRSMLR